MSFQSRKQKIIEKVEQQGLVDIREIALSCHISEVTVRRDLVVLAQQGLVIRTHGGAMKVGLAQAPVGFAQKAAINAQQKDEICQLAASVIQEGDVVFLDCGSTVFRLCPFIRNLKIHVVTNSLPIANALLGSEVKLNFAGGEIDFERQAAHGKMALEHFGRYHANKAFLGVDGLSLKNGLSANSEKEAETTLALAKNAQKTYFLCDSSKLEQDRYLPFAPISLVQNLITDSNAPAVLVAQYKAAGVKVWQ